MLFVCCVVGICVIEGVGICEMCVFGVVWRIGVYVCYREFFVRSDFAKRVNRE